MLDIRDLFDKDMVYEQRVQDLSTAYNTVERLFDFSIDQSQGISWN